jgi:hypothetical protein
VLKKSCGISQLIYIIRRAIKSRNTLAYISHLSIDFIIAIIATFWVLFVFIISGWLIQTLTPATPVFGLIMGLSASLPTCIHVAMFIRSCLQSFRRTGETAS